MNEVNRTMKIVFAYQNTLRTYESHISQIENQIHKKLCNNLKKINRNSKRSQPKQHDTGEETTKRSITCRVACRWRFLQTDQIWLHQRTLVDQKNIYLRN